MENTMDRIFVFGSNLAGRHGKGAALTARQLHGAIYGQSEGLQGQSYAIPTKDKDLKPRSLEEMQKSVEKFKQFAIDNPTMCFYITAVGCGLAGYSPDQIGPFFKNCPSNCELPEQFKQIFYDK
jgi:hypothetical protein